MKKWLKGLMFFLLFLISFCIVLRIAVFFPYHTKIIKIERVTVYGTSLYRQYAKPGNVFLLIMMESSDEYISSGYETDIHVIDKQGNVYAKTYAYIYSYVFEVPDNDQNMTLVIRKWLRLPIWRYKEIEPTAIQSTPYPTPTETSTQGQNQKITPLSSLLPFKTGTA
jgi:hypothetical protein